MPRAHVSESKKKTVDDIVKYIEKYPIIGAINMRDLPASALQKMRGQLRGKVEILMTKRRLMKIAIEKAKAKTPKLEELQNHLGGMPALLFTNENPFGLFKILKKNKSMAPAKAGQTAPRDIIVPAGPTPFAPGPVIAELGSVGIKAGVEGGKVAIKADSLIAKQGEVISAKKAEVMTRLGIQPMEIGLDLVAVYEKGVIYPKSVLDIDETEFMNKLMKSVSGAFNLAMHSHYTTKDTIRPLVGKAHNDAKALGISQKIFAKGVTESLLAKANMEMMSLKAAANIQ